MCGHKRKSCPRQPASKIKVDLAAIDARLQQLTQTANTSSYSKQKSSLRVEFETFLASLPNTKSIYSATPEDVSRFLIWKDRHGKRVVHVAECVNAQQDGVPQAHALLVWGKCSRRLSGLHTGFTDFSFFRYFSHGST